MFIPVAEVHVFQYYPVAWVFFAAIEIHSHCSRGWPVYVPVRHVADSYAWGLPMTNLEGIDLVSGEVRIYDS